MRYLQNLAVRDYDKEKDEQVKEELELCDVHVRDTGDIQIGEVKTRYNGEFNGFQFKRCWRYWQVTGEMAVEKAREIYEKYKEYEIRAEGFAGNPNPVEVAVNKQKYERVKKVFDNMGLEAAQVENAKEDEPGDQYVIRFWHIDTLMGLKKFREFIQENGIMAGKI